MYDSERRVFKVDRGRFGAGISRSATPLLAYKSTAGFGTEAEPGLNPNNPLGNAARFPLCLAEVLAPAGCKRD